MNLKKIIAVLIAVIGLIWLSCESPSDENDDSSSTSGIIQNEVSYESVIANNGDELLVFLSSASTAYEINLNIPSPNIYINTDISITMPMRIIGNPENITTIHTHDNGVYRSYFCIDLKADLELEYCNIAIYDKIVLENALDILDNDPELPPLIIRPGINLVVGMGASLNIEDFPYFIAFPGGTVIVAEGGSFNDKSVNGTKVFDGGISNLIIDNTGNANLGAMSIGDQAASQFQVIEGSFRMSRIIDEDAYVETVYIVDGTIILNNDWVLPKGQSLHIKSGDLIISEGAKLILNKDIAGLILDSNIVLKNTSGLDLSVEASEVLTKFSGRGHIAIDNKETGVIYKGNEEFIGSGADSTFKLLDDSRIEINARAIYLLYGEAEFAYGHGTYDLEKRFIVNANARLTITPGSSLRAPLENKLEGTLPIGGQNSSITVMSGAAMMVFPGDSPYYPDIPVTNDPINLEWNFRSSRWIEIP